MLVAFVAALSAQTAQAGNLSYPIVEPIVDMDTVAADASANSNDDVQLALMILTLGLIVTAAIAN